ncbi:MAG: YaeQ family protein [Candidatus Thiodiazotropha sp.]
MALKATIFKVDLQISDMERHHYQTYQLTLARHPSETDQRLMVRLLAFAINADHGLTFTKGLCNDNEPELWLKNLSGETELWIELGQLDEKRLRRACGQAKRVIVYLYARRSAEAWWSQYQNKLLRYNNLQLVMLSVAGETALESLSRRTMSLQATIQDNQIWLSDETQTVTIEIQNWFP